MRGFALALGPLALLVATEASAQLACAERPKVLQQLADQYQEAPVAVGLSNNGGLLELLSSSAGDSWTLLLSMPDGTSCLVAAGESWQFVSRNGQHLGRPS